MPGKLPGGKVRISKTAPVILSNTKVSPSSEVKYYGLIRDNALSDLESPPEALEEILKDVQDPAERSAEGEMNQTDLSIIDGIVNYDIKYEDLEVLEGASLKDGEGGALVNPRQRLADRISQFESFAGRGTPFTGAGPVKFIYIVPKNGDLLEGSVEISTSGNVTGVGTTFSTDLVEGDFVILTKENGVTPNRLNAADKAIYKVTGITSNLSMTVEPAPSTAITAGKKLRKRYCHNNPPPFFTENIDSTEFNAPDHIPNISDISKSHRQGFVVNGVFKPFKENESWWEGAYNQDFQETSQYGGITNTPDQDPSFPIVKDSNISFEFSKNKLSQDVNFGIRYDALLKRNFENDRTFFKWLAQVNGQIKIDYFKKTSINSEGEAVGSWVNVLDSSNPDTYFSQVTKEQSASNTFNARTFLLQGGPNYASSSTANVTNVQDLSETYTTQEGTAQSLYNDEYIPVVIRYWYGQNTIDESTSDPIPDSLLGVEEFTPSFMLDLIPTNLISTQLPNWNNYFGAVKLIYNSTDSNWEIDGTTQPLNYETDSSEFNQLFEVIAYDNTTTAPTALSTKNLINWFNSIVNFSEVPSDLLTGERVYDTGTSSFTTNRLEIDFPTISSPSNGDVVYALIQNRPRSVLPQTTTTNEYNRSGEDELWQKYLFNPDYLNKYEKASDLIEGSTNFIELNPEKIPFENNTEYFRYKYGKLPKLGTYGPDRYDGTIVNRITTSNTQKDYDYSHNKLLFIGRQKKSASIAPLQTGETRNNAENYTFITVEEDEAGNGGEVTILAKPVNSMAAINNTAGADLGGKVLHSSDNTVTFSNSNRQGISNIQIEYLPLEANYDNGSDTQTLRYETFLGQNILSYVSSYTGSTPNYDTTGIISSSTLGLASRHPADSKSIYIASFDKNKGTERFFYGLISAERRVETAQLTLEAGKILSSNVLFSNNDGDITDNNQPYIGATVEFYLDTDTSYETLQQTKLVESYDAANEKVTLNDITGLTEGNLYNVRVYYNYFVVSTTVPTKTTEDDGTVSTVSFPTLGSTDKLQIRYIYNNSYQFIRVDSGSGLNFSETLFVASSTGGNAVYPFGAGTELPSPPSALVAPFGFDNGPTDPNNPGLGGICYPPYAAQDLRLQSIIKSDAQLYSTAEGNFDVYFGSPQVSQTDLGNKHLLVTDQLLFDFSDSERSNLISETGIFPQFNASSYTHKLKVELNPDVAGLFTRASYTGVSNDNIFKDVLKYSNNKPVKETFWMFAKKADSAGEADISLLTENNPAFT